MESVKASAYSNWMHLVLDNASPDDSPERLRAYFSERHLPVMESSSLSAGFPAFEPGKTILLCHDENRGFAAGNNEVLQYLQQEDCFVWLLNPDVRVQKDAMRLLAEELQRNPLQVLGCSIHCWQNPEKVLHAGGFRINWISGSVRPVKNASTVPDYIYGASLFTHAQAFKVAGLFPEDYFLYWEESHWCLLALQKGYALKLLSDALVYDKVGGSTGRGYLAFYYYTRNGLRFISKFRPGNVPLVVLLNFARMMLKLITFRSAAARGIWKGTLDFLSEYPKR